MITDFQFSSKLTGLPELVLGGLQELRKEYITDSDGPEVNASEPGQRSVN